MDTTRKSHSEIPNQEISKECPSRDTERQGSLWDPGSRLGGLLCFLLPAELRYMLQVKSRSPAQGTLCMLSPVSKNHFLFQSYQNRPATPGFECRLSHNASQGSGACLIGRGRLASYCQDTGRNGALGTFLGS